MSTNKNLIFVEDFFSGNYRVLQSEKRSGIRCVLFKELIRRMLDFEGYKISLEDDIVHGMDFALDNNTFIKSVLNLNALNSNFASGFVGIDNTVLIYLDKAKKHETKRFSEGINVKSVYKFFSKKTVHNFRKEISKLVEYKGYID